MVFYFSATGNSKYAAHKLKAAFGGEMIDISKAVNNEEFQYEPKAGEKVFFTMPVYFWTIPETVSRFLDKLQFTGETPAEVCAVLTCESSAGGADNVFRKKMKGKNCEIKAVYKVDMPNNCVIYFQVPNPEAQVMQLRKSEKAIEEIIESVKFNYRVSYKSSVGMRVLSAVGGKFYHKCRKTKKFRVKENCSSCRLCSEICPENAIAFEAGRPVWKKDTCAWCLACINRCPEKAIEYGKKTETKGRYFNPYV